MSKERDNFKAKQRSKRRGRVPVNMPQAKRLGEPQMPKYLVEPRNPIRRGETKSKVVRTPQLPTEPPYPYDLETNSIVIYEALMKGRLRETQVKYQSTRVVERDGDLWRVVNGSHTLFEFDCNPAAFDELNANDQLTIIQDSESRNDIAINGRPHTAEAMYITADGTVLYQDRGFTLEEYQKLKQKQNST